MRRGRGLFFVLLGAACSSGGAPGGSGAPTVDAGVADAGALDREDGGGGAVRDGDAAPLLPGLDARPLNPTCRAPARPEATTGGEVRFVPAFPNMNFEGKAVGVTRSRLGSSGPLRWFVVERGGDIWTFVDERAAKDGLAADGATAVEKAELFFRIPVTLQGTDSEGGMLSVAFDPELGARDDANFIYAHYTADSANNVARYRIGRSGGAFVTLSSERIFTTGSGGNNHWGGDLKFGPDGFLYLSLGDGGRGYTESDVQKLSWLRGKILRIDPRSVASGYAIPADNPFRGAASCDDLTRAELEARTAACPEIYAYGLRNPWRMSFDRETGRLWVGDVGTLKEEIDLVVPGKNYGWPTCDGVLGAGCPPATASALIAPIAQYRESPTAAAVVGGHVYRGRALGTAREGSLIFSDVYSGELFVIDDPYANVATPFAVTTTFEHPANTANPTLPKFRVLPGVTPPLLVSFAEDENGELLAVTLLNGKGVGVYRLSPPGPPAADAIALLSETGCVDPADARRPASGVLPYEINAPAWTSGASVTRYLAIPDAATITVGADGDLDLPSGSVTMMHLRLAGKLIETRLFARHLDGGWAGYTYAWNDAESDAELVPTAGATRAVGSRLWRYPSRSQCVSCHAAAAGGTLGLETRQLEREVLYPSTGRVANQLATLAHVGYLSSAPAMGEPFADPFGAAALEARARSYLHVNCSGCHRGSRKPALAFDVGLGDTGLCAPPALLVPGSPSTSRLVTVLGDPDPGARMPRNGGDLVDDAGVKLLEEWISSRTSCP